MIITLFLLLYGVKHDTQLSDTSLFSLLKNARNCNVTSVASASLTIDGVFAIYFTSACNSSLIRKISVQNTATNKSIQLQQDSRYPQLYYSKVTSTIAASPAFIRIKYADISINGFVPVSIHRTPCLINNNINASVYERALYIYPRNFSIIKGSSYTYCDTYLNPHLSIYMGSAELNCAFNEYYYSCNLAENNVTDNIIIYSIYSTTPVTILANNVVIFTKLCLTSKPKVNSEQYYMFSVSLYIAANQSTIVMRHPYLAPTNPTPPSADCLPLAYNCTYNDRAMNRFNYHFTINQVVENKPSPDHLSTLDIKCNINSNKVITQNTPLPLPIVDKSLCFHSFHITEKFLTMSVTSIDEMFAISNMKLQLTPFLLNIQDKDPNCIFLPNAYLRIETTIYQKNYTNYAFNYQEDNLGQQNASLIALTNLHMDITSVYMLLPYYTTDSELGDITIGYYQGVPIFNLSSYLTSNCYATDQIRYFCNDNVLYIVTENVCLPSKVPTHLNFTVYDSTGSLPNLTLDYIAGINGPRYHYNYTEKQRNEICTQKPYFSIDKYEYGVIYFLLDEKFPVSVPIELTNTYCSLVEPTFKYQLQLFKDRLYLQGYCKLVGYCYIDTHSYIKRPLKLVGTTEGSVPETISPTYRYIISNLIRDNTPYIVELQKCSRSDIISQNNTLENKSIKTHHIEFIKPYSYFQSPSNFTINWNNQTLKTTLNYTPSCIEALKHNSSLWFMQIIETANWGILTLSIAGEVCNSADINVDVVFFAKYIDLVTQKTVEQPILSATMVTVETASASHKLHINDRNLWDSYLELLARPSVLLYTNLTLKYAFYQEELSYITVRRVNEPCLSKPLTTRLIEVDFSTSIFDVFNQHGCYMLCDYLYLVLPTIEAQERKQRIEKNINEIFILEELLLSTFYSVEDLWAFIELTNILDISLSLDWNRSDIPHLQLKPGSTRHHQDLGWSFERPIHQTDDIDDIGILSIFKMRKMTNNVHELASSIYKYWTLVMSSFPYLTAELDSQDSGMTLAQGSLPRIFQKQMLKIIAPNYDKLPTLADEIKKDLNNLLATKIITNQDEYNLTGLLDSKVITFRIGKSIFYSNIPLSFYQYNTFVALILTLGNSDNKKKPVDDDILIMRSQAYTPHSLTSEISKVQVEMVDDFLTIYCSSCTIYDSALLVIIQDRYDIISRNPLTIFSIYLSKRNQISEIRYNYTYTIRTGITLPIPRVTFFFPIYDVNTTLSTQIINNVCFLDGFIKAFLKSNQIFFIIELINCVDVMPSEVSFILLTEDNSNETLVKQFNRTYRPLTLTSKNSNWVSFSYSFKSDPHIDFNLLVELAQSDDLEAVIQVIISNTLVKRVVPIDPKVSSPDEMLWWIYLLLWFCMTIVLFLCVWFSIIAYRNVFVRKKLLEVANVVLDNSYMLKRDIIDTFPEYVRDGKIINLMLALNVLIQDDFSVEEIAECCQTTPQVINKWMKKLRAFSKMRKRRENNRKQKGVAIL